ncbi:MAG: hypothetical protein ACRC20_05750 [Segniliparus sp.]|uniref:hypothetical protein n=1 Tax=Segniliparus sp. TaxID=2804064 RepID=UPI003F3BC83A
MQAESYSRGKRARRAAGWSILGAVVGLPVLGAVSAASAEPAPVAAVAPAASPAKADTMKDCDCCPTPQAASPAPEAATPEIEGQ